MRAVKQVICRRTRQSNIGGERAAELAALDGPVLLGGAIEKRPSRTTAYVLPAKGKVVFGFHELNITGYRERGIRMELAPSTSVSAPAAGKVSYAGRYRGYGQIVIIEHGNGWTTLITNLAALNVTKGQTVRQGAALGSVSAEQSEIGVELRKNGRVMDIAALLT
jgi:murein hydrolase activator